MAFLILFFPTAWFIVFYTHCFIRALIIDKYKIGDSLHSFLKNIVLKWQFFYFNQNFRQPLEFYIDVYVNINKIQQLESPYHSFIIHLANLCYKNGIWLSGLLEKKKKTFQVINVWWKQPITSSLIISFSGIFNSASVMVPPRKQYGTIKEQLKNHWRTTCAPLVRWRVFTRYVLYKDREND